MEETQRLIAEATRIFNAFKKFLDEGYKTVHDIPTRVEDIKRTIASRQEEADKARARYHRASDENADRDILHDLRTEDSRAYWRAYEARERLGGESVDFEYQKAVARQIGGLVREQATQEFKAIAARIDDPKLRAPVEKQKDEISKEAYRLIQTFPPGGEMLSSEVRKAQTEAHNTISVC